MPRKLVLPTHIQGNAVHEWIEQWESVGALVVKYGMPDRYEMAGDMTIIEWNDAP